MQIRYHWRCVAGKITPVHTGDCPGSHISNRRAEVLLVGLGQMQQQA